MLLLHAQLWLFCFAVARWGASCWIDRVDLVCSRYTWVNSTDDHWIKEKDAFAKINVRAHHMHGVCWGEGPFPSNQRPNAFAQSGSVAGNGPDDRRRYSQQVRPPVPHRFLPARMCTTMAFYASNAADRMA